MNGDTEKKALHHCDSSAVYAVGVYRKNVGYAPPINMLYGLDMPKMEDQIIKCGYNPKSNTSLKDFCMEKWGKEMVDAIFILMEINTFQAVQAMKKEKELENV